MTVSRTIGASNPSSNSWSCPLQKELHLRHLGDGEKNDVIVNDMNLEIMIWYPFLCGENNEKTYLQNQHRNHSEDI